MATPREIKMDRIARAFDEWEQAHLDDAPFIDDPNRPEGTDYPEHHFTVSATRAQADDLTARIAAALAAPLPGVASSPSPTVAAQEEAGPDTPRRDPSSTGTAVPARQRVAGPIAGSPSAETLDSASTTPVTGVRRTGAEPWEDFDLVVRASASQPRRTGLICAREPPSPTSPICGRSPPWSSSTVATTVKWLQRCSTTSSRTMAAPPASTRSAPPSATTSPSSSPACRTAWWTSPPARRSHRGASARRPTSDTWHRPTNASLSCRPATSCTGPGLDRRGSAGRQPGAPGWVAPRVTGGNRAPPGVELRPALPLVGESGVASGAGGVPSPSKVF